MGEGKIPPLFPSQFSGWSNLTTFTSTRSHREREQGEANIVRTLTFFSLHEMPQDLFICYSASVNSVQLVKSPAGSPTVGKGYFPSSGSSNNQIDMRQINKRK